MTFPRSGQFREGVPGGRIGLLRQTGLTLLRSHGPKVSMKVRAKTPTTSRSIGQYPPDYLLKGIFFLLVTRTCQAQLVLPRMHRLYRPTKRLSGHMSLYSSILWLRPRDESTWLGRQPHLYSRYFNTTHLAIWTSESGGPGQRPTNPKGESFRRFGKRGMKGKDVA
eukprot:scaffold221_cov351-Pavlova_lutheri.AAC.40